MKELFDLASEIERCITASLDEFNRRHLKLFDLPRHQRIFLFVLTRSIKTYSSILELCRSGYGQDVATLLRSLMENLITVRYITYDKSVADEKAFRFVSYKWVIFKKHLPELEREISQADAPTQQEFSLKKKSIFERVEEFKRQFKITSDRALMTWSGKTVKDMAKEVDEALMHEYEYTFRMCSRFSHPSILGDQEYLIQDDKSLIFSALPSDIGIVPNLKKAVEFMLEFLLLNDQLFQLNFAGQLEALKLQCHQVFSLEKYKKEELQTYKPSENHSIDIRQSTVVFRTKPS